MFVLIPRPARPDVAQWPGRRTLAAVDAVVWPLLWVVAVAYVPIDTGLAGTLVAVLAVIFALRRLHRAVWHNGRYWFTTWRWGKPIVLLVCVGIVMKQLA